jgi:hypothetical protein
MSVGLPAITQIEFDAQVKAAYQSMGLLRPHVRVKTGVVGGTTRFRRYARGVAKPRVPQTDVSPMNTQYAEATATLADWHAAEYTAKLDQALTNIDERNVVATNIGGAIARRMDQMILDALDAAVGSPDIAAAATGLTDAKMRRAQALFDQRAVPQGKRKMAISARAKEDLLSDPRFSSRDYVESYVVRTGMLPPIYGFDIVVIDNRDEGGLPLVSTTRTNFAWDADAIGLAIGVEPELEVNYIPEKTSWLSVQELKAGSVAIDVLGVVEIATVEA